jgi:alcohol dehydrogenase
MWVKVNAADMEWVKTQIETNRIRIVIDKVFPLDQAREALAYSESGKVKGKIVITMI